MQKTSRKKTDEVRIYPEQASLTAKVLKLRMQGYGDYRIAKELGFGKPRKRGLPPPPTPTSIKRIRERIEEDYPRIRHYIKEIEGVGYFALKERRRLSSPQVRERADSRILELLTAGIPLAVGNAIGGRAVGYRQVENKIEVNPETRHIAEDIFQTYLDGGNMSKVFRNHNIPQSRRRNLTRMIRNPLYIGKIIYKGHEFYFKQLVIIDEKIWQACQPPKGPKRCFSGVKVPYGFVRRAGRWEKTEDPEIIKKIKAVIVLRIAGESYSEIAAKENLSWRQVYSIINNPKYAGKVFVKGEPVDAGFEGFVSWPDWQKAHKTSAGLKSYEASRETRRRERAKKIQSVKDYIRDYPGARWSDLVKQSETKYGKTSLSKYIRILEVNKEIEKRDDRWYAIESASTRS